MFYRFNRSRSLKTRAKQIDKLRRKSRWDWDANQRPFFNAKHVRCASHFGGPKYNPPKLDAEGKKSARAFGEEDGFELTEGEKKWKENMERMRKRIEQDPYEAVFGKRFPPFWSPSLSPLLRWTGEELGLKADIPAAVKKPAPACPKKTPEPVKSDVSTKRDRDLDTDTPNGQLTNYSYSASTAWDSRTNKTRGQEWDSVSGETKNWVYDPITNRRIQIQKTPSESANPVIKSQSEALSSSVESVLKSTIEQRSSSAQQGSRKPIGVPTATAEDVDKTSVYFPSLLNTSVAARPAKTSAITKSPESDLDLLTAEDIRASMRVRQDRAHYSTRSNTSSSAALQPALHRMPAKEAPELDDFDDSAAHESTGDSIQSSHVPRDWDKQAELLQTNRVLRSRGRMDDDHARLPADNDASYKPEEYKPPTVYMHGRKVEENGRSIDEHERTPADNDPTLNRFARFEPPTVFMDGRKVEENGRKIELDELARTPYDNDPTMDKSDTKFKPPTVYMNGRKVEENGREIGHEYQPRTPCDNDPTMESDTKLKPPTVYGGKTKSSIPAYDPTADKQSRYQRKVLELKRELDLSYEQSTINSEMHAERIRELERALQSARTKDAAKATGPEHIQAEGDFDIANIAKFAKGSAKWYKQPTSQPATSTQSTQHTLKSESEAASTRTPQIGTRDNVVQDLLIKSERENGITYREATEKDTKDLLKEMAEKDRQISESRAGRNPFTDHSSIKVDKEMASAKYKNKPDDTTQLLADYAEKNRQICESQAGRKPFPNPLITKVDKEMAEKYKHKSEDTTKLLADYAERDRQIGESRAGRNPFPDPLSARVDKEMAEKYKFQPEDTAKLLDADAQREKDWAEYVAKKKPDATKPIDQSKINAESWNVQWTEPPVYKVLAYDSGNDMFSTATTSSNFTSHESPISIQDALSQLYQPARFVPHFAELQKEGYQVIFGTKDLLLFKKREDIKPSLVDHGLVKPSETRSQPITSLVEPISHKGPAVNPIDGTSATASKITPSYVSPGCPNHWSSTATKTESTDSSVLESVHDLKKAFEAKRGSRVHREERVFSGRKRGERQRSELTAEEIELLRKFKGGENGWASRLRWALGVGVGASAVAYGVGAAVEKKEMRDRERWEDVLEGSKYGRKSS